MFPFRDGHRSTCQPHPTGFNLTYQVYLFSIRSKLDEQAENLIFREGDHMTLVFGLARQPG